jgi:uncharacterized protein (DUF952 family)
MSDNIIYHITSTTLWELATAQGYYEAPSLAYEGFIHCSQRHQIAGVLERYYQGVNDLILLVINTNLLQQEWKYELAPSVNEEFPHIFGPINLDAVVAIETV